MGRANKGIRVVITLAIAVLYFNNVIEGTLAYILMALSKIFLLTSFIGFCPLYAPFGVHTNKKKQD